MRRGLLVWITSGACRLLGQVTAELGACPCAREHEQFAFVTFPWMQQGFEEVTAFLHNKLHYYLQTKDGYSLNLQCWHCLLFHKHTAFCKMVP